MISPERLRVLRLTEMDRKRCSEAFQARKEAKRICTEPTLVRVEGYGIVLTGNTYFVRELLVSLGFVNYKRGKSTHKHLITDKIDFHTASLRLKFAESGVHLVVKDGTKDDVYSKEQLDFLKDPASQTAMLKEQLKKDKALLGDAALLKHLESIELPTAESDTSTDVASPRGLLALPDLHSQILVHKIDETTLSEVSAHLNRMVGWVACMWGKREHQQEAKYEKGPFRCPVTNHPMLFYDFSFWLCHCDPDSKMTYNDCGHTEKAAWGRCRVCDIQICVDCRYVNHIKCMCRVFHDQETTKCLDFGDAGQS